MAALLASKRVERHSTSANEFAGLRKLVARGLSDATVPGLSPDRAFATAYNAVLQLSKMALACAGYRVSATLAGHHQTTFEAAGHALGASGRHLTDYFETCRRKRNVIDMTPQRWPPSHKPMNSSKRWSNTVYSWRPGSQRTIRNTALSPRSFDLLSRWPHNAWNGSNPPARD